MSRISWTGAPAIGVRTYTILLVSAPWSPLSAALSAQFLHGLSNFFYFVPFVVLKVQQRIVNFLWRVPHFQRVRCYF